MSEFRFVKIQYPVEKQFPITRRVGDKGQHWKTYHKGTDFKTPVGIDIYSVLPGTVFLSGFDPAWSLGKRVWIISEHPDFGKIRCGYCHLSEILVKVGEKVEGGALIGRSGNTGNSTGAHLHFQVEVHPSREILKPAFI